jgi:hypothetical protein
MTTLITTTSGSRYELREPVPGTPEIRRVNPDEPMRLDETFVPVEFYTDPIVGLRMILTLRPPGLHPFVRSTSPVVAIEDVDEPPC